MNNLAERLIQAFDYDFAYDDTIETAGIIKFLGFKPRLDADTPEENLVRFMKLMRDYTKVKIFVGYGLYSYFSIEEVTLLSENLQNEQICLIDIESRMPEDTSFCLCVIDNDLCGVIDN